MTSIQLIAIGKNLIDFLVLKKPRESKRLERYSLQLLTGMLSNSEFADMSVNDINDLAITLAKQFITKIDKGAE